MGFSPLLPIIRLLYQSALSAFDTHYSNIPTIHHSMGINDDKNQLRRVPQETGLLHGMGCLLFDKSR
jgi:hypothetical protein